MKFRIEQLEERLAPCTCTWHDNNGHNQCKGNNGVGNGLDPQPPRQSSHQ